MRACTEVLKVDWHHSQKAEDSIIERAKNTMLLLGVIEGASAALFTLAQHFYFLFALKFDLLFVMLNVKSLILYL